MVRFEEEGRSVSVELREVSRSSHEEELYERQEGPFVLSVRLQERISETEHTTSWFDSGNTISICRIKDRIGITHLTIASSAKTWHKT